MIEMADPCDVCKVVDRKARKEHKCCECSRKINPGETYEFATTITNGEGVQTYKCCTECQEARAWLCRECGGYVFGFVEQDLLDHWYEDGIHTMKLARLIVGFRRRRNSKAAA